MATGSEAELAYALSSFKASTQRLREGCRVELAGFSSEELNGQRGTINGSYLADRECWPVVVDATGGKLSCKHTNLKGLVSCGNCGAEKALDALKKCIRCRAAHYCNGDCQRAHWKRCRYRQACREQFACVICLDDEEQPLPIQCGCGCRDAAGCAHVACKIEYAEHQGSGFHEGWRACPTCKQNYTGPMQLGLAEALWAQLRGKRAKDGHRLAVQNHLATAYKLAGRLAKSEALYRDTLATRQRVHGPNDTNTLVVAGNLGTVLLEQGKDSEAEAVFRDTLERQREHLGTEHEHTLRTASRLAAALQDQRKYAEAEPLARDTLASMVMGKVHPDTLATTDDLASLLVDTGSHTEAEELCRSPNQPRNSPHTRYHTGQARPGD